MCDVFHLIGLDGIPKCLGASPATTWFASVARKPCSSAYHSRLATVTPLCCGAPMAAANQAYFASWPGFCQWNPACCYGTGWTWPKIRSGIAQAFTMWGTKTRSNPCSPWRKIWRSRRRSGRTIPNAAMRSKRSRWTALPNCRCGFYRRDSGDGWRWRGSSQVRRRYGCSTSRPQRLTRPPSQCCK